MTMPMSQGHQTGAGAQGHPWAPSGELMSSAQGHDRGKGRAEPRMASRSWCWGPAHEDDGDDRGGTIPTDEDEATSSRSLRSAQLPVYLALSPHMSLEWGLTQEISQGAPKAP